MRNILVIAALCTVVVSQSGCLMAARHAYRAVTAEQPESQVNAALDRYKGLVLNADSSRLADMFEPQGELFHGDQKPVGHDALLDYFKARFASAKPVELELRTASTTAHGSSGTQHGSYRETRRSASGETIKEEGSFEAQWRREADGRWLLQRLLLTRGGTGGG